MAIQENKNLENSKFVLRFTGNIIILLIIIMIIIKSINVVQPQNQNSNEYHTKLIDDAEFGMRQSLLIYTKDNNDGIVFEQTAAGNGLNGTINLKIEDKKSIKNQLNQAIIQISFAISLTNEKMNVVMIQAYYEDKQVASVTLSKPGIESINKKYPKLKPDEVKKYCLSYSIEK